MCDDDKRELLTGYSGSYVLNVYMKKIVVYTLVNLVLDAMSSMVNNGIKYGFLQAYFGENELLQTKDILLLRMSRQYAKCGLVVP